MKKFLIAGSSLAAVAAAGSAGAVDVTLGGSIELGFEFGVGKDAGTLWGVDADSVYQNVSLSLAAAGTTDAGMKFGGSFALSTAGDLKLNLWDDVKDNNEKHLVKLVNTDGTKKLKGAAYQVSGGDKVDASEIVSVKINSEWYGAESKTTAYDVRIASMSATSDICKIAGRATADVVSAISRSDDGATQKLNANASAYLPAGKVAAAVNITAQNSGLSENQGAFGAGPSFQVGYNGSAAAYAGNATVYAGPYMEVMLTSSTTKMVVGAVCVTNTFDNSETAAYLDLASRVMQVGQASIYIEGGFGKLTLQQGAYAGKVAAIGDAGDEAGLDAGLVAVLEGASLMGMSGYGAVDVTTLNTAGRPNYLVGTTVDLMGLSVAVEFEDVNDPTSSTDATNLNFIDAWDASTSYAIGDLAIDAALDSDGDWGLKATAAVGGFSATSIIENVAAKQNEKSGLSIDTTLATSFNGIGVTIGLDENLAYTLSGSYSIGSSGLAITAGYSSASEGGKIAAKLSF